MNGTGQVLEASTCLNQTLIQTRIIIFSAISGAINCSNLQCNVSDKFYQNEPCSVTTWFAELGTMYYIVVVGSSFEISGQFALRVGAVPPPTYCAQNVTAIASADLLVISGNTSAQNSEFTPDAPALPNSVRGHWFRFVRHLFHGRPGDS